MKVPVLLKGKPFLFCVTIGFISASACASNGKVHGSVYMKGAVVETACGIAVDSLKQTINMGVMPKSDIIRDGVGRKVFFDIKLENCILPSSVFKKKTWHAFSVTFDGESYGKFFNVSGDAKGIGLVIYDAEGRVAMPGQSLPKQNLQEKNSVLNYAIQVVSNNEALKVGRFFSNIKFKLDYY